MMNDNVNVIEMQQQKKKKKKKRLQPTFNAKLKEGPIPEVSQAHLKE
jgi:hypothetical protein